jgi:hypothetical protein
MTRYLAAFAVAAILAAAPASAGAGSPGRWDRFSPTTGANNDEVGLTRTADNVLHVIWQRRNGAADELWHTPIAANGTVGASSAVQTSWAALQSPALVAGVDGLTLNAFWGGIRSASASDPYQNLNYAYSSNGGSAWTLWPGGASANGGSAYSNGIGAARLSGTFFEAWAADVHRGIDTTSPVYHFTASPTDDCCGYNANVAADQASNAVLVAWYSNQTGYEGVWVQSIDPATGQPVGAPTRMPRSATTYRGALRSSVEPARTPLVARLGAPGFVVAYPGGYPTTTRALVWRAGSPAAMLAGSAAGGVADVGLAAAPGGRVWVFWSEAAHGARRIVLRRSNADLTAFGAPIVLAPPNGTTAIWKLDGSGQAGALDLVASVTAAGGIANWHTQVLPSLSVTLSRDVLSHAGRTRLIVTVADAGSAIRSAKVRDGSKSARTNGAGRATLTLGPFSRRAQATSIRVSAAGYGDATVSLRLRR